MDGLFDALKMLYQEISKANPPKRAKRSRRKKANPAKVNVPKTVSAKSVSDPIRCQRCGNLMGWETTYGMCDDCEDACADEIEEYEREREAKRNP